MIDRLDGRAFRRLQLAAQAGHTLGLLLRPPSAGAAVVGRCAAGGESVVRSPLSVAFLPRTTDHGPRTLSACPLAAMP